MFAAALAVKAAVLVALGDHPLLQPRGALDTAVYIELAKTGPPLEPFFVSPLYLYFLRVIFISGGDLLTARVIQIILGAAAVVLVADTARIWFGARAAWIAGTLMTLTGAVAFYEITILQSALDPFLTALMLWTMSRKGPASGIALGAATALLVLNRPNVLVWAAALSVLLLWRDRARLLPFIIGATVTFAPVVVRNWTVAGEAVLIASHGGLNFYIGNNPEADGTYRHVPGIRPDIRGQQIDTKRLAERSTGRVMTARDVSRWFYDRALRWIASEPVDATRLFLKKVALTLTQSDVPLNHSYAFFSRDVRSPLMLLVLGPWLLFPLAALGAIPTRAERRWPETIVAFFVIYALSVAIFFVASRYQLPLLSAASVLAGGGAVGLIEGPRRLRTILFAALFAVVVLWDFGVSEGRAEEASGLVFYHIEQGRFDEARALLEQIEARHTDPAMLYWRTGLAYRGAGREGEAIAMFERARDAPSQKDETRLAASVSLAEAYARQGRGADALAIARTLEATQFDFDHAARLGRVAIDAGDGASAVRFLGRAASLRPDSAFARHHHGVALILSGDHTTAMRELEAARQLDPTNASTRLNLAVLQAQAGQMAAARENAREALRLRPGYAQAEGLLREIGEE